MGMPDCVELLETNKICKNCTRIRFSVHGIIYKVHVGTGGGWLEIGENDNMKIYCSSFNMEKNEHTGHKEIVFRSMNGDKVATIFLE